MSTLELKPQHLDTNKYAVKCQHCGKFISREQIEKGTVKFHFIPDNQFGPEEAYWEHIKC